MKTKLNLSKLAGAVALCVVTLNSFAVTYTSISDGNWDNTTDVWSTDGETACECTPGGMTNGDRIIINHNITLTYNVTINGGSKVVIFDTGSLTGCFNLFVDNSDFTAYGDVNINRLTLENGATFTLSGAILQLANRLVIDNSTLNIDNGLIYMTDGNIDILGTDSQLNLTNGSRINVSNGNITNAGTIFIDADCCLTTNGNWNNLENASVTGSGSATTIVGNMKNDGDWSTDIAWCSAGFDFGMPSTENCLAANEICENILLPIELVKFEATLVHDDYVELVWETASEHNNDYFTLMRTTNGTDWTEISRIDGAGNSTVTNYYVEQDKDLSFTIAYYKLVQYDTDGKSSSSRVISVKRELEDHEVIIYPNPTSKSTDVLTIGNINEDACSIYILSSSGSIVAEKHTEANGQKVEMNVSGLEPNTYYVNVKQCGNSRTTKLIVID